jgi:hypothetical protein
MYARLGRRGQRAKIVGLMAVNWRARMGHPLDIVEGFAPCLARFAQQLPERVTHLAENKATGGWW